MPEAARPVRALARVMSPIVQRHAEDASFYWARHADAMAATDHDWQSLRRMEQLLEAHLEGLRVAQIESSESTGEVGSAAWEASKTRLTRWGTTDEAFVAGSVALHARNLGTSRWLDELHASAQAQFDAGRGDAIAAGMAFAAARRGDAIAESLVSSWWQSSHPLWQRAGLIAARAFPALQASLIPEALRIGVPDATVADAAELAGRLGMTATVPALLAQLGHPAADPATKRAAAVALGRLVAPAAEGAAAWRQAEAFLLDAWITDPATLSDQALTVLLWRAAPGVTHPVIEQLLRVGHEDRRLWREALRAIRLQGDARWVPVLLQCMEHQNQAAEIQRFFSEPASNVARLAGDVFAHITGARIGHQRWREAPEPSDDDADETLDNPYVPAAAKRDPDGALLWPDVAKLNEEWRTLTTNFESGQRYVGGDRVSESTLLRALGNAKASQQQRAQSALLLQLARAGAPCFDVGASTVEQDRQLALLGVSSWNW